MRVARIYPPARPEDFPAAHSMDTTWFAVDQDGHVARFDTGEDGAVPNAAPFSESFEEFWIYAAALVDAIAEAPVGPPPIFDREDHAIVVLEPVSADAAATYRTPSSSSDVESLIPEPVVLRESGPRIVASRKKVSVKLLGKLADHPDVRVIWTSRDVYDRLEDKHDMYVFANNGTEPGEYVRESKPAKPLVVGALPEPVRNEIGLALPVKFADAETIHLADHMKDEDAQMWGEGVSLRGEPHEPEPPPRPARPATPAQRPIDWFRIVLLLLAVLGIAYIVSRK